MTTVLVPVRYPLSSHSIRTLRRAVEIAEEQDAELIVLHVNLFQNGRGVTRSELKRAVETELGEPVANVRYSVTRGFLVEETILEEVASEEADIIVMGHKQIGRWRRAFHRLLNDPNIATFVEDKVDCEVVVVRP